MTGRPPKPPPPRTPPPAGALPTAPTAAPDAAPDTRQRRRCPICDGPTYASATGPERCRNSLCVFNHRDARCPRCRAQRLRSVWLAGDRYHYSCGGCQNTWDTPV